MCSSDLWSSVAPTRRGVAAERDAGLADLQHERSVLRKLQHLMIGAAVPCNPDIVVMVDEDPVLVGRPLATYCCSASGREEPGIVGTTPRPEQIAFLVELHD